MPRAVAVVGAGAAGAATATALADVADVTVFERRSTVGGRSRTCERDGCRYETGANYVTPTDDRVAELIDEAVPAETLVVLDDEVWPFDERGTIDRGDDGSVEDDSNGGEGESNGDSANRDRRLTTRDGLESLTESILTHAGADVVLDTEVEKLVRIDGEWRLCDADSGDRGTFDAVVLTPPAPLTADLLGRSEWPHADCREVREGIASVPYRPIASVVLHYPFELETPWYALVNDDREHPIGWIAREDCKPGHVPDGDTVLLVQCSSDFTREHYDADPRDVVDRASALTAGLLEDDRLASPDWHDFHCWRYGVPREGVDPELLAAGADHDLYAAGDWVVGEDRLNGALRSGLATGETVRGDLF